MKQDLVLLLPLTNERHGEQEKEDVGDRRDFHDDY